MSDVLSDVVGCHRYDLWIIGHLQQPRQDPVRESEQKESLRNSPGPQKITSRL